MGKKPNVSSAFPPAPGAMTLLAVLLISAPAVAAPFDTSADAVIGQPDFASVAANQPDGLPTAANLALSNAAHVALAPDGRLYVSDADNNRILSWADAAGFTSGQAADLVIGQANFSAGAPNRGELGGARADGLWLPQGLSIDESGNLWVADAYNNRVLRFDNPPASDGVADLVIGKPDFTSNGPYPAPGDDSPDKATPWGLLYPGRVIARAGDVWVCDSGNSRVLHYTAPLTNEPAADLVLGQYGSFYSRAKNNDGFGNHGAGPSADNLLNCIGIALDAWGNLFVADWQNHRVLRFDDPLTTDTTADAVLGQPDFTSGSPDSGGLALGLHLPIDVYLDVEGALYVADSFNHRILVFHDPLSDFLLADAVFGQLGSFTSEAVNHGLGPLVSDADGLFGPTGIAGDGALNLFVADANNNRVLRFDAVRPPAAAADFDLDGDVDAGDHSRQAACLAGPHAAVPVACLPTDLDTDADVDLADFARLQRCYSGAGVAADADCGL